MEKGLFVVKLMAIQIGGAPYIDEDLIIHTAARARAIKDEVLGYLKEYRQDNVNATINLARQAAEVGLKNIFAQYS